MSNTATNDRVTLQIKGDSDDNHWIAMTLQGMHPVNVPDLINDLCDCGYTVRAALNDL